jgi:2-keto-4-pentenoate hydratase/2-oxohepta-3-ene-1,7-dioic acid hydratase in catechol pathway
MKIICIGRNYSEHAKELGNDTPTEPVVFLKPDTAINPKGHPFFIPEFSNNVQHEIELVIKINKVGKHIQKSFANKYYSHVGLGIDFTARDLQQKLKEKGLPWEKAKGFDGAAFVSKEFIHKDKLNLENIEFSLKNNNNLVQKGNSKDMIFDFDQLISYVSKYYTLKIGDLIFTGTPSGVAQVKRGDKLHGFIKDQTMFELNIR